MPQRRDVAGLVASLFAAVLDRTPSDPDRRWIARVNNRALVILA
jgi:hypothetical protein